MHAVVYHAPEQDELSKTKLRSSAQFLRMPAVEHSAPELKNRTSSQEQHQLSTTKLCSSPRVCASCPSQTVQWCKSSRGDKNFFYMHIAATWTASSTTVCSWSQLDLYAKEMSTQLQGMSTQPSVGHFRNERSSNKPRLLPKRLWWAQMQWVVNVRFHGLQGSRWHHKAIMVFLHYKELHRSCPVAL
jgi:hypothetical protein